MQHVSAGMYQVTITAPACAHGVECAGDHCLGHESPRRSGGRRVPGGVVRSRPAATSSSWCSPAMSWLARSRRATTPSPSWTAACRERMHRGALRGWAAVAACGRGLSAGRGGSAGGTGRDDLDDRRWRQLQRLQCLRATSRRSSSRRAARCRSRPANPSRWGENAYWMTTAPPGITINQALTENGDVNAGGWTTGVVDRRLLAERHDRRVGRIDARAGPALVKHRARGQPEHQQPDLRHPDRLHTRECPLGRLLLRAIRRGSRFPESHCRARKNSAPYVAGQGRSVGERILRVESARGRLGPSRCMPAMCPESAPPSAIAGPAGAKRPFGAAGRHGLAAVP